MLQSEFFDICRENFSNDEYNILSLAMESAGEAKMNILRRGISLLTKQIMSFFRSKETRDKLINKEIYNSNGDITKVETVNTHTLPVIKILQKSKVKDIKKDADMLMDLYNFLKSEKNSWMLCKSKAKKSDMFEAVAAYILYAFYCLSVMTLIQATSIVLARVYNEKAGKHIFKDDIVTKAKECRDTLKDGSMKKVINYVLRDDKKATVHESVMAIFATLAVAMACFTVFFLMRVFVFYYYYTRMELSDYFEQQANFLNVHKAEVNSNKNLSEAEKKAIVEAQKKWVERFMYLSDLIVVDDIKAARKVEKKVKESNKEINPTNIINVQNVGMDFF